MHAGIIQFDEFELDLGRYQLRRGDRVVKLENSPMELLILLVENQGRLVTREEIIQRLWGDKVFVDTRHGINTAIHKLRAALRDDPDQPRILETVVGKGYRLVAATVTSSNDPSSASLPIPEKQAIGSTETRETAPETQWIRKRSVRLWAAGVTLTASMILAFQPIPSSLRDRILRRQDSIRSLAVLPFENLSGDPSKDYFADGFTEELTTDLAEQTRILVVSRTSVMRYKGSRKPLPEIASELKVDAIVEGSVVLSEQQVRITAQLIQASSDRHLWAHSYERDRKDLLPIQNEVAATIAGLIREKAQTQEPNTVRAASVRQRFTAETYELYLECRNLAQTGREDDVSHSIECYQHILDLDPNCAPAYAGLAYSYEWLRLDMHPKARNAAVRALELDPSLPEAHDALADIEMNDGDLKEAEVEFKRALALNPSYAGAHSHLAGLLLAIGRTDEAIAENRTSRELDPYSAPYATLSGIILFMAGQYDRAIEEERAALALDPQHERAHFWLGYVYEQQGMYKEAIAEYEKVLPHDSHCNFLAALGRSLSLQGDSKGADEVRGKIEHFSEKDWVWPYDAALFYTTFGDKDRAFTWLEKDYKQHYGWTLLLNVDPRLSSLRSDPRFRDLVKRVGVPVVESH